ncbi:MAG: hypothetical protein QM802_18205 [Agriterribacter sp.]
MTLQQRRIRKFFQAGMILLVLFATTATFAQNNTASQVDHSAKPGNQAIIKMEYDSGSAQIRLASRQQFSGDFPAATDINFWQSNGIDVISFLQSNIQYKAYYDAGSKLIGTVTPKTIADIPANALASIRKKYKDFTIDKVIFFDDNELNKSEIVLYGQTFGDADDYFAELKNGSKKFGLRITMDGSVSFFEMK